MEPQLIDGLTAREAQRLKTEGKSNEMPAAGENDVGDILRRNIFTLFNLLNVVLAIALVLVGSYRNLLFMGVVLSNALIGTVQELRAKRTHDRLMLLSRNDVRVMRDGAEVELPSGELVLGDIVRLSRGDQIPADAEVICGSAQADESLLTGESVPIAKREGDTLYSGGFLTSGSVTARLIAVGAESVAGKLQASARKVKRADSKLMTDMKRIIRWVSIAIVPMGILLFVKQYCVMSLDIDDAITKTVASILGMIPEGLILLTSISLAAGVVKLGGRKALVNELYGIESLARTNIVCMDKTGTLTSGDMSLQDTVLIGDAKKDDVAELTRAILSTFGEHTPTNAALEAAFGSGFSEAATAVAPFSSERKWSAASFESLGTVVLGAPERLLEGDMLETARARAAEGLRVLALMRGGELKANATGERAVENGGADGAPAGNDDATCNVRNVAACTSANSDATSCNSSISNASAPDAPLVEYSLPDGLKPVALICLRDEFRPRVTDTVRYFGEQDVALKVISGDSPLTVSAVAKQAGVPNAEKLIDLSLLSAPVDYDALSREYTVFGRVSPDDKRELIEAMKRDGHGVAMIGDGVNDIPALKAADCSIAMAGGSDAACRVAQITLLNADFEAMPSIVLEGRRVINNITRASSLFLVKNIFSCLLSLVLLALPFAYPFMPIQLTLVSSLTVGFPSFVLALQPSRERVKGDFIRNVIARAMPGGICVALLCVALMLLSGSLGYTEPQLSTLCTLIAGYSGLVALLLTCLPLNALRAALVTLVAFAMALAVMLFPQVFYLEPVVGTQRVALAVAAVLAPLLQIALGRLIRQIRARETGDGRGFHPLHP